MKSFRLVLLALLSFIAFNSYKSDLKEIRKEVQTKETIQPKKPNIVFFQADDMG
ncbi:hypothetical protein HPE56_06965 [Maribacter sp. ANRC-HE7]|uniref:Sulfatase n=1 Tax=Maribacter aquimaris TaxID=2737171 RepID=A0ABR7V2Y9_9FLAO|nr:hypothetical protein [Maribacter aquimaris]MBD0777527.1 hypothetical protein [Maribacter aquimaris]